MKFFDSTQKAYRQQRSTFRNIRTFPRNIKTFIVFGLRTDLSIIQFETVIYGWLLDGHGH